MQLLQQDWFKQAKAILNKVGHTRAVLFVSQSQLPDDSSHTLTRVFTHHCTGAGLISTQEDLAIMSCLACSAFQMKQQWLGCSAGTPVMIA